MSFPILTSAQTAAQKVPKVIQSSAPTPVLTSERFTFRNVRGTRQQILDAINNAKQKNPIIDPATNKAIETPIAPEIKQYLTFVLNNLKGDIFVLDAHVHQGNDGEWMEHIHIKQWA